MEHLHSKSIPVYLISGGFKCIIAPIAAQLNVPTENIFANRLKFYYTGRGSHSNKYCKLCIILLLGEYAGFDESAPTSKSGGKSVVVDHLKRQHGYKNLVLIGDGATDLEASPPADAFIGTYTHL